MRCVVIWSDPAIEQLRAIAAFLLENAGDAVAIKVHSDIGKAVAGLSEQPFLGAMYEKDRSKRTREIFCHPYRIFYEVNEQGLTVNVLSVWHGSRRDPELS